MNAVPTNKSAVEKIAGRAEPDGFGAAQRRCYGSNCSLLVGKHGRPAAAARG